MGSHTACPLPLRTSNKLAITYFAWMSSKTGITDLVRPQQGVTATRAALKLANISFAFVKRAMTFNASLLILILTTHALVLFVQFKMPKCACHKFQVYISAVPELTAFLILQPRVILPPTS